MGGCISCSRLLWLPWAKNLGLAYKELCIALVREFHQTGSRSGFNSPRKFSRIQFLCLSALFSLARLFHVLF